MKALHAGIIIKSLLLSSEAVSNNIQNRVYPIIAEAGTKYPFILYTRTAMDPEGSKDAYIEQNNISVAVSIISDRYEDSIEIADKVIPALQTGPTSIEGFDITEIRLIGFDEDSQDDAYIQNLVFNIEFNN